MRISTIALALCAMFLLVAGPSSQARTSPHTGLTVGSGVDAKVAINGQSVAYRARFVRARLPSHAAAGAATISGVSYVRTDVLNPALRPVLITWGGGPGWPSTGQAYQSFGPKLLVEGANPRLIDNPNSILDVADLLVIDAVGTGFSHVSSPAEGAPYWGLKGDADAFERLIRSWLRSENRLSSPIYLAGESYGGTRMGMLVNRVSDINIAGFVLVSPGINLASFSGDATAITGEPDWNQGIETDQSFIQNLPSYATAAFYHHRIPTNGRSLEQVFEEARAFAQGPYAEALQLGAALPAARRRQIAARMAELTGIPAPMIDSSNLRVMSQAFLENLLPGQLVSRLDTRVAVPKHPATISAQDPNLPQAVEDPSIPWVSETDPRRAVVEAYLRSLGAPSTERFAMGNLGINSKWDWSVHSSKLEDNLVGVTVAPNLARYMHRHPRSRVFVAGGFYDLAVPLLAPQYSLMHVGLPISRFTFRRYRSGHEVGDDGKEREVLVRDIRSFVSGGGSP